MRPHIWGDLLVLAVFMGLGLLRVVGPVSRQKSREREGRREHLRWWAGSEGWASVESRPARPGPFGWRGWIQPVVRFTVEDERGETRSGWALFGGGSTEAQRRALKVAWDDAPGMGKQGGIAAAPSEAAPLWDRPLDGPPA